MENEALKEAFVALHAKIMEEVNPDSVIDRLFGNKIISAQDYSDLCKVSDARRCCRNLLALLHVSPHPEAFIQLRDALRSDYPGIVDEIENRRASLPNPQPQQQLHLSQSTEGKLLLVLVYNSIFLLILLLSFFFIFSFFPLLLYF